MPTTINPVVHYRDLEAGVRFLVEAFGFEQHEAYKADDGTIQYVELSLNGAPLGLGPHTEGTMFDTGPARRLHLPRRGGCDAREGRCCRRRDPHAAHRPGLRLTRLRRQGCRGQRVVLRHLPAR